MEPISRIDPLSNQLFFRGYNVTELSISESFESVLYLLVYGKLPSKKERETFSNKLINLRKYYTKEHFTLNDLAMNLSNLIDKNHKSLQDTLLTFVAIAPLVIARQICDSENRDVKEPKSELEHVANFIWMAKGILPNDTDVRDVETSLILHMDDPSNPSLTTLHTSIAEGKSISDALLAALSVHVGSLHHGAGTEAMKMLEEISRATNLEDYFEHRINSGKKIFGLGHRIYRGVDPRAIVLRKVLERRTIGTSNAWLLEIIDRVAKEGSLALKNLKQIEAYPNVDLYNAAVYYSIGFPPAFNTELFAISRAAGWMAHILEWKSA
jgi:citrate synthase